MGQVVGGGWVPPSPSHPLMRPLFALYLLGAPASGPLRSEEEALLPWMGILEGCHTLSPSLAGTRPYPVPMCGYLAMGGMSKASSPQPQGLHCAILLQSTPYVSVPFTWLPGSPLGWLPTTQGCGYGL